MRLLNARTKELELRRDKSAYAIVSHRWGAESEEVLFTDISDLSRAQTKERGYKKIHGSCSMALSNGLAYVWIDTCCIDKRFETELTTAINSMYEWYRESEVCYAYLDDVGDISEFTKSKWFSRGWTLQELIAPRVLKFFAKDWTFLGTREDLIDSITKCTGIKSEIFLPGVIPDGDVSVAQRMYWAAKRTTKREEDRAYSLLGLFDIHLPAIYGIRQKAFQELQFKIVSKSPDKSLFAWQLVSSSSAAPADFSSSITGLLAASPSQYLNAYEIPCSQFYRPFGSKRLSRWECFSLKNGAVCVTLPIRQMEETSIHEALLRCSLDPPQNPLQSQRPLVVYLKQDSRRGRFVRVHAPASLRPLEDDSMASFELEKVYVDEVSQRTSCRLEPGVQTHLLPQNAGSGPVSASSELASYEHSTNTDTAFGSEVATSSTQVQLSDSVVILTPDNSENIFGGKDVDTNTTKVEGRIGVSSKFHPIRHPPGSKIVNIVVCGEPGAGAGGIVNLIAGSDIVDSRTEFKCAPMAFTTHDISLDSRNMRIFYAIGPQDHRLTVEGYNKAMENVEELAQSLRNDGGVHVLLCCMLRTKPNRNIHCLFYEALCGQSVPVIVLGTDFAGLGRNLEVGLTGIRCNKYASISVIRPGTPEKSDDYENSVKTVRKFVIELIDDLQEAYHPHVGLSVRIILKEFMSTSAKRALTPLLSNEPLHASSGLPGADPHSSSLVNSFAPKLSASVEKDGLGSCSRSTTLMPQIESKLNDPTPPCLPQPPISVLAKTFPTQTSQPITPPFASVVLQFAPQSLGLMGSNCSMPSRDSKGKKRALTFDEDVEAENTRPRKQGVSWPSQDPVHIVRLESDDDAGINYLAFSSGGTQLAVVCNDHTVRIWDMARRVETARLDHNAQITAVAWMSDNISIISLGRDGVISKWACISHKIWRRSTLLYTNVDPVCFAYQRNRIAVALPRAGVKVWIWTEGTWESQRSIPLQNATSIQFVEGGDALIGGTSDGILWYCQVPNGMPRAYAVLEAKVYHLDVNGQGTHALVSQAGGRVHLMGIRQTDHKGKIEQVYSTNDMSRKKRHDFGAVFASAGKTVLFGSTDGNLLVWDKFKGEVICSLDHGESRQIQAAACTGCDSQACIMTGTKCGVLSWWKAPSVES